MSSRKEEERNEKIIRGLMKLPPNRRCINCNSLGPQYVCTTFWTFVCTTCSGIHREFTHRVKSVSMAKFTSQEVEALQNGGNQRAIEKYLRDRDPQKQRLTDNSNAEKIRQFIKDAYMDKKYAAPRSSDKPPRDLQTMESREEEMPRANSYHSFSQSPPYDYQYEERRYGKHAPALTRKPGSDKGMYEGKLSSFLSPTHSNDHTNEGRLANEGAQSPNFQKDMGNPFGRTSDDTIQVSPAQRTSFGSFGSLDSMSFKSESVGVVEVDSEPEQVINAQHSLPSLADPSVSVDLFQPSRSLPLQTMQNPQTSYLDLFSEIPQQLPASTIIEKLPGIHNSENGGWATFDSQNVEHAVNNSTFVIHSSDGNSKTSVTPSSDGNSGGDDNPLFLGSCSPFEDFAADNLPSSTGFWQEDPGSVQFDLHTVRSQWSSVTNASVGGDSSPVSAFLSGSHQVVEDTPRVMDTQSWKAFEDHTGNLNSQHPPTNVSAGGDSSSVSVFLNGSHQIVEDTAKVMDTQSWNAFQDPTSQLNSQNLPPSNEHVQTQYPSDIYYHVDNRESEDFTVEVIQKADVSLGMSSDVSKTLDNFPMHVMEVAHKNATGFKPSNPFDQPYDSDIEPSNVFQFWEMSSLDAALPNGDLSTDSVDDETHPWFTSASVTPYVPSGPQGALGFMAGQAGSTEIPNLHAQGPVANVGGNPFA